MIARNCQFCFVEIDPFMVYKNHEGSILCRECFNAGRTLSRHEIKLQAKANMIPVQQETPDNSHYTKGGIEPWTYIKANDLNFFEGSVVKYVTRWKHKNGIEDLRKARVYIDELIRQEEEK